MSKTSFIYKKIFFYRIMMNVLYRGNYYKRFEGICKFISGKNVTELCFGDSIIAEYCKKNNINWSGLDVNESFVKRAQKKGLNANFGNVMLLEKFPPADTLIISGSLYHFHEELETLFEKMFASASRIIISEPIINLSNNKGIVGKLAKVSATINGKVQNFRYTGRTLAEALTSLGKKMNFEYKIMEQFEKDLIIVIQK